MRVRSYMCVKKGEFRIWAMPFLNARMRAYVNVTSRLSTVLGRGILAWSKVVCERER
jgi:hypothetical protein